MEQKPLKPATDSRKTDQKAEKAARLQEALRQNLRRRKQQSHVKPKA